MNYRSVFLKKCRDRASKIRGRDLEQEEFAKMLKKRSGKGYSVDTYKGAEKGATGIKIGLEMMEAAARAADFELEECISIPGISETPKWKRTAIRKFSSALDDDRFRAALDFVEGLDERKKTRQKTGGRKKQPSSPRSTGESPDRRDAK